MTSAQAIAAAIGVIALLMLLASQHGIGTTTSTRHDDPPDGDSS